jgi:hypothetical protein
VRARTSWHDRGAESLWVKARYDRDILPLSFCAKCNVLKG